MSTQITTPFQSQLLFSQNESTLNWVGSTEKYPMSALENSIPQNPDPAKAVVPVDEVTPESVKKSPLVAGDPVERNPDLQETAKLGRSSLKLNMDDYKPKEDEGPSSTDETRPTDPEYPMQHQITTPQNKR
jgi:hypothetical protein